MKRGTDVENSAIKTETKLIYLKAFMFLSPFFFGGYHIWTSALFSVALSVYLMLFFRSGEKKTGISMSLLSVLLIPAAYLVTSLWAVDSGTAVYGFIKFLPVALFAMAVVHLNKEERSELFDVVPYSGAVMGVLSYSLSLIPSLSPYFLVAERLGGFFQYPNSFACYCLIGIPILLLKEKTTYINWLLSAVLVGIILLTGSRTVFIMLVAVSVILLIKIQSKHKVKLIILMGGLVSVSLIVALMTDNIQTIGRYLTISAESSTLLGRLLYYKDALPVILKHPFGLGYYGYYFSQGSFQNGVYSVAFIHNELLQLLLDIGWIPALLFTFVLIKNIFSAKNGVIEKIVIMIICGHSMLDFDLQFVAVFLVLVLALDFEGKKLIAVKHNRKILVAVSALIITVSVYFGLVNGMFLAGKYEAVDEIYGKDTQSKIFLMTDEDNYEHINEYAEGILKSNKYVSVAYSAKANYSFKKGDISSFMQYKEKAIECARYSIDEYNDYCAKLLSALSLYLRNGDGESAQFCAEKLVGVEKRLSALKDSTDTLARKIKDKPELELKQEYSEYIKELQ